MAETPLVETDVNWGASLVKLMDEKGMSPKAAFWLYSSDTERWRLVIGIDEASRGSRDLYLRLIQAGADSDLSSVEFQRPDSPFIKAMSQSVRVEGLSEVRMRDNVFNGVYVQDALIYRMAA